jgi:hypothetical protein
MVVIIDGEIVQDNDPRAIARRGGSAGAGGAQGQAQQRRGSRVTGLGDLGSNAGARGGGNNSRTTAGHQQAGQAQDDDVDGLLTPLSKILGIQGRRLEIPSIPRISFVGYSFPLIHMIVALFVLLFTGNWRYGLLSFFALAILNPK